jgi:hypothetical protein
MLKRLILWDFPRASWPYDMIVGLVLAFIFVTPREWFNDQPRIPHASAITMVPPENGSTPYFVDPQMLDGVAESEQTGRLSEILQARMKNKRLHVIRVQPIRNSEGELQGYLALARQ